MRRMSFSATTEQMRNQTKTVTRRHVGTWKNLQPGDHVLAIEKGMGLPKGKKQVPIGVIEIVSNTVTPLSDVDAYEATREGFPSVHAFRLEWLRLGGKWHPDLEVRRIEFRHNATDSEVAE